MARVKMQSIVEHLSTQMKRALEAAVQDVDSDSEIDRSELYRAFKRAVGRKCSTWETVPDSYVDAD